MVDVPSNKGLISPGTRSESCNETIVNQSPNKSMQMFFKKKKKTTCHREMKKKKKLSTEKLHIHYMDPV